MHLKICFSLEILVIFFITGSNLTLINGTSKVCDSEECVFIAADLLTYMDHNVDPCKDFYSFACGRWQKSNPHIASVTTRLTEMTRNVHLRLKNLLQTPDNSSDPYHWRKAKKFYKTCLNMDKKEKSSKKLLLKDIERLGGWPVLEGRNWIGDDFNWIDTLGEMFKTGNNKNILLTISLGADYKNTSRKRIFIDQPIFGMKKQHFLNKKYVNAYLKMIIGLTVLLKPGLNTDKVAKEMEKAVGLEHFLAQLALSIPNKRSPEKTYHPMKIRKLMENMPQVNWLKLINSFLPDEELTENDEVVVKEPEFLWKFSKLMSLLNKKRRRDLANYMFYRMIVSNAIHLPKLFRGLYFDFRSTVLNVEIHPPMWFLCMRATTSVFPYSMSSVYTKHYFRQKTKHAVNDMVQRIRDRLIYILMRVKWMDDVTRTKALEKAVHMSTVIGCADDILNDSMLNRYYGQLSVGKNHYENMQNAKTHQYNRIMRGLNVPINKKALRGHSNILMANAYYSPFLNTMNIPVGILQNVMFNENYPNYINYGRLGSIVGHEMTHAFDDKGAWYDENGNWKMWWADNTYKKFVKASQCLVKQYDKFYIPELHRRLNGTQTLGENIADNCGVRESYLAYQRWVSDHGILESRLPGLDYTPNQLFWISYATGWCSAYSKNNLRARVFYDVHPPARNRILATVSNSNDFAKDFDCPKGSPLNPPNKCTVWI